MESISEVVTMFLGWTVCFAVCGFAQDSIAQSQENELLIRSFEGIYEPSAAVAIEGGGLLLFEDDGPVMLSLHHLAEDESGLLLEKQYSGSVHFDVTDIEGAAKGEKGSVFVVTSHSLNKHGERDNKREQLFQLKVNEKKDVELLGRVGLRETIIGELLKLDPSMVDHKKDTNIEGLSFSRAGNVLMFGLRNPLYKGKAIVLQLENPYEITNEKYIPKFSPQPLLLDIGGTGVRAMTFHEGLGQYFFVSEVRTKKDKMRPRLWSWDGERQHDPVRLNFPGLKELKNIEGLTFFRHEKQDMVLFVCDDGNKKKKQGAHYAIVEVRQLQIHEKQE